MSTPMEHIEQLFCEKILLYQEMAECLKSEQKSLMETDVELLWKFSEKKQALVNKAEDIRVRILEILDAGSIEHGMDSASFSASRVIALLPDSFDKKLKKLEIALVNGKNLVQAIARQNKAYVVEYLEVIDELARTITAAQDSGSGGYANHRYPEAKNKMNLFLHREV